MLALFAKSAGCALGDAVDQDAVAFLELLDVGADLFDDANAFVAEGGAGFDDGDVAIDDVQVGATEVCRSVSYHKLPARVKFVRSAQVH